MGVGGFRVWGWGVQGSGIRGGDGGLDLRFGRVVKVWMNELGEGSRIGFEGWERGSVQGWI